MVKTIGSARDPEQISRLVELGKAYITRQSGQYPLFPVDQHSNAVALEVTGEVIVELDDAKIAQAARWDGLKGYLTTTELPSDVVIETYGQLWQIERAFRISKTDLRIRPMYHYRRRRIEAHVLVAFVAYTIYKELERCLGKPASS